MAAITGLAEFSKASCTSKRLAPFCAPPNSVMSAPAMKVRPSQMMHDGLGARIGDGQGHAFGQAIAHGGGERVHGRGIEGDDSDVAFKGVVGHGVDGGHGCFLLGLRATAVVAGSQIQTRV